MIKEHILRYGLYLSACVAFGAFVIAKNESLMDLATEHAYRNGDLYRLALVRDFKVDIPDIGESEDIGSALWSNQRIIFIGDSFSETCRGHRPLPDLISRAAHEPIYRVDGNTFPEYFNPIYLFKAKHFASDKKRVVIVERVEREIISTFADELDINPVVSESTSTIFPGLASASFQEQWFTHAEQRYQFLLQSSSLTTPLLEVWNTTLFHLLGKISAETPAYSLHPPFLFYADETISNSASSFYFPHPDSLVEMIADNIAELRQTLADSYNAELVFMPVPSKYTLYHSLLNDDPYDNYLPRLSAALTRRGVKNTNIYKYFAASKETLYFPTDSHWNANGAALALVQTMKVLNESTGK
jgi:hypothetical protein